MTPSRPHPTSLQPPSRPSTSHRPSPLHIQIPSLHDSLLLTTHLHVPAYTSSQPFHRRCAILAHPYSPLGGSLTDPVLQHLTQTLLSHGFIVALFNFRGAGSGREKGRTSWTGKAEQGDYRAVASWVLAFTQALPRPLSPLEERGEQSEPNTRPGSKEEDVDKEIQLILGGYSYGALISSLCPPVEKLLDYHINPPTKPFSTSLTAAIKSAHRWHDSHSPSASRTSYSGVRPASWNSFDPPHRSSHDGYRSHSPLPPVVHHSPTPSEIIHRDIVVRYLLISPVLPPISTFLMLPLSLSLSARKKEPVSAESVLDPGVAKERGVKGMLVCYGDEDVFTGVKKYRKWKERMGQEWAGFEPVEVEGATHFWGERELGEVKAAVEVWIEGF